MSDKMIDQFKNFDDLSAFARAQQKTLVDLTKKNKKQDDEIKHLKKLLEGAVPVINNKPIEFSADDDEHIAREQLFRLKQLSSEKELTLEEAKRVEIYTKILNVPKGKPKDINAISKNVDTRELLALLPGPNDDRTTK